MIGLALAALLAGADGGTVVFGSLPKEHIKAQIDGVRDDIAACYSKLIETKDVAGKLVVRFTVAPDGAVQSAETRPESTLQEATLDACMLDIIRGLHFQPPKGGGIVVVTYPFVFSSKPPKATPAP